jgi:hypothetical protein
LRRCTDKSTNLPSFGSTIHGTFRAAILESFREAFVTTIILPFSTAIITS